MKKYYPLQSIVQSFIVLFILLSSHLVIAEDDIIKSPYDNVTDPTPENLPTYSGTCEDLTPAKNLDDLILQLYSHLDDDCLYLMPSTELGKKLGVEIISLWEENDKLIDKPQELDDYHRQFNKQPYHDLKSGIFIFKQGRVTDKILKLNLLEQQKYSPSNSREYLAGISYTILLSDDYKKQTGFAYQYNEFPSQLFAPQKINTDPKFTHATCKGEEVYWYGYAHSSVYLRRCNEEMVRAWHSVLTFEKRFYEKIN